MPICARRQTNGPPGIDQGFSQGSNNRRYALSPTHLPLSAGAEPIFKLTDCAN